MALLSKAPGSLLQARGEKGGGKGGGGSARTAQEAPNTLTSRNTARIVDLICEGEIGGLVDGFKSVFLDGTPVENEDGSRNFPNFVLHERNGTPDQDPILGFPSVETEVGVGVQVKRDQPVTRRISDPNVDAVRIKVRVPSLTEQNLENGDLNGSSVRIAIDLRPDGGAFSQVRLRKISGKTTSPYEEAYRIDLPESGGPWDVRVRRITEDSEKVSLQNDTWWSSYTLLIDNKLSYPDSAVMGLEVDAEQFSTIPSRGYECYLQKFRVPSNYDPVTREYSGVWDGTFKIAWSDSPPWFLYALMTSERFGLGERIPAALQDKWTLYSIAQYCDELIPDGFGGMEPRFTFNGWINSQQEAYGLLASVAQAFRGMIYWGAAGVTAVQDSPQSATRVFSPANVIEGNFNYEGQGLQARHSVALVKWWDPADGYRQATEVVEDPGLIVRYGWQPTNPAVVAWGCTSRGRAHRVGRWLLETEKNEGETISFKVGLAEADLRPGEVFKVSDPNYADLRHGGRLKSATLSQVVLDAPVTLAEGETYTLTVVLPDKSVEDRGVTTVAGTTDTLDLDAPLSAVPIVGGMWALSGTDVALQTFRAITIREEDDHLFAVTGLRYDPGKFARIEQNLHLDDTPFTALPSGTIEPPIAPSIVEYLYEAGPSLKTAITLSWSRSPDPRVSFYEYQHKPPGAEDFGAGQQIRELSADLLDVTLGEHAFRVRALDGLGQPSRWVERTEIVLGEAARPPNIESLFREGNLAVWRYGREPADHLGFLIRHNAGNDDFWEGATPAHEGVYTETQFPLNNLPGGTRTLLVKGLDRTGNESADPAVMVLNLGDPVTENVVEETDYATLGWPGLIENGAIVGDRIESLGSGDLVWADDDAPVWADDEALVWAGNHEEMVYTTTYSVPADKLDGSLIVKATGSGSSLRIDYQPGSQEDVWVDDNALVWADDDAMVWRELMDFRPWPGVLPQPDFSEYTFRVTVPGGLSVSALDSFLVQMDVPDIQESFDDLVVPPGGIRLPITKSYRKIKRVNITLQDDGGTARRIVVKDKNFSLGPLIEAFDGLDVSASALADVTVQGY